MRKIAASLIASVLMAGFSLSHAENAAGPLAPGALPDGTVTVTGGGATAGVGHVWGSGGLYYEGESHPFKISGASFTETEAVRISVSGDVYNLKKLSDFNGSYIEVSASVTGAAPGTAVFLENEHGVVIKLEATPVGLRANLSGDRVKLSLER